MGRNALLLTQAGVYIDKANAEILSDIYKTNFEIFVVFYPNPFSAGIRSGAIHHAHAQVLANADHLYAIVRCVVHDLYSSVANRRRARAR